MIHAYSWSRDADPAALAYIDAEWLLTSGVGGFALGTISSIPTRRYHGLLIAATQPPLGRIVALHSVVERLVLNPGTAAEKTIDLSSYRFRDGGGVAHTPAGHELLAAFVRDAGCTWTWRVENLEVTKSLVLMRGSGAARIQYVVRSIDGAAMPPCGLLLRPLTPLRDFHALTPTGEYRTGQTGPYAVDVSTADGGCALRVRRGALKLSLYGEAERASINVSGQTQWWHDFVYTAERARGQDDREDLFSPGQFVAVGQPGAGWSVSIAAIAEPPGADASVPPASDLREHRQQELDELIARTIPPAAKAGAGSDDAHAIARLAAAADDFIVRRGGTGSGARVTSAAALGVSVIAGYPWFSDWGRDTMISLPGLLLATGRHEEARRTLVTFARYRRKGLIPNVFNDQTGEAAYNTVDAPLWFVHAACEYLRLTNDAVGFGGEIAGACADILSAYQRGTDGAGAAIAMDPSDGLIAAGDSGTQLTWMDAKRDGVVFTPRHGKAVEINALWHHALVSFARAIEPEDPGLNAELRRLAERVQRSFRRVFFSSELGYCYDTVTLVRDNAWAPSAQLRPNQIFAVSLRHSPLSPEQQRSVLDRVRSALLTPRGVRTLDPGDRAYVGRFDGTLFQRDAAYHNGTAWPWLLGPLAEATLRVGGFTTRARAEARAILAPIIAELSRVGPGLCLGQIAEVYDGDDTPARPQAPGGCVAQAWSVAETLRVMTLIASGTRE